jgi:hypothetical protein
LAFFYTIKQAVGLEIERRAANPERARLVGAGLWACLLAYLIINPAA